MTKEQTSIDWGDGTKVVVKTPKLEELPAVMCPPACNPADGDPKMEVGKMKKVDVKRLPCSDIIE